MKVKVASSSDMGLGAWIAFVVVALGIVAAFAGLAVWLVPVATAGALALGFWQAVSIVVLLCLIKGIFMTGK